MFDCVAVRPGNKHPRRSNQIACTRGCYYRRATVFGQTVRGLMWKGRSMAASSD